MLLPAGPSLDPAQLLDGTVALLIPHMDDGVLACGGTLARLPDTRQVHVIYATDGRGSPEPVLPWRDSVSATLPAERAQEAREAMALLGVPPDRIRFLDLPDGGLARHEVELEEQLGLLLGSIGPDHLLAPFRYDRHADHLALNRVATRACARGGTCGELIEYFVYHHSRLLRERDIRRYIRPGLLFRVEIDAVSETKRKALDCFRSQTTRYYDWQSRPNLTPELLDQVSREPEYFIRYDPQHAGARVFDHGGTWIRVANRLEPLLKRRKDRTIAVLKRLAGRGRPDSAGQDGVRRE
jgi:LmbE family N-acetylglucosaminyl deacetylase